MNTMVLKKEREIIKSAKKVALKDGYEQIIYLESEKYSEGLTEEERYSFSRLYSNLNLFNSREDLVIGIVDITYNIYGCPVVEYISARKFPEKIKKMLKNYNVAF